MAYDESLAARILDALSRRQGITERRMFGGVGFLRHGHLLVGVWKDSLVARLGPGEGEASLREPHVRVFDITGRPMRNWVLVEPAGVGDDDPLTAWVERAWKFVEMLPGKPSSVNAAAKRTKR